MPNPPATLNISPVINDDSSLAKNNTVSAIIGIIAAVIVYVFALLFSKTIVKSDVQMLPKGEKICKVLEKYDLIG